MMQREFQVSDCKNQNISVLLKNGYLVNGVLSFFNYDSQVVHVRNYVVTFDDVIVEEGDFTVLNGNSWARVMVPKIMED